MSTAALRPMTADDFRGDYPGVTELPMTGGAEGEHYGWGHIDAEPFAAAATAIDRHLGVLDPNDDDYDPGYVHHRWALTTYERDGEWEAKWVAESEVGAWPITTLDPADH